MNPHFKKPLKVTLIAFVVGILLVIGGTTWIFNQKISERKIKERASMMGAGLGGAIALVLAPFWLVAAARVGKEKRERQDAEKK